jgi:hydroxypyruvate isomerase
MDVYSALERIASLGFAWADIGMVRGFCPHFDPLTASNAQTDEFVERVSGMPLRIATLNVGHGALNRPAERDEQMEFVRRCLDLAARLKCYAITMQPGVPPEGDWVDDARAVAVDLTELADKAEGLGLKLTLETPHTGTLVTQVDEAKALLDLSESTNLYVALDTSHVMRGGTQPSEGVELLGDRVGHVHLRDARGEDFLLTPGDGEVDFAAFYESLKSVGYDRPMILELEYEEKTEDETADEVLRARDYLKGLWGLS